MAVCICELPSLSFSTLGTKLCPVRVSEEAYGLQDHQRVIAFCPGATPWSEEADCGTALSIWPCHLPKRGDKEMLGIYP